MLCYAGVICSEGHHIYIVFYYIYMCVCAFVYVYIYNILRTTPCQFWGFTSAWGVQRGVGWSVDSRLDRVDASGPEYHEQSAGNWRVSWGASHRKGIVHTCARRIDNSILFLLICCCWLISLPIRSRWFPVGPMPGLSWLRTMWAPLLGEC
jgi:hypothetical protein